MSSTWKHLPLGELCQVNIGRTPARERPDYWGHGNLWLSIADMKQGRILKTTKERITDVAVRECNCRLAEVGTILFSFKLSIGKVGIASVPLFHNEAIASLPIRDKSKLLPNYLYWALQSINLTLGLDRAAKGLTLNKAKLLKIKLPIPPLEEQRQIAEILDRTEELRSKRKEAIALLDTLTQSIFFEMFGDPAINPKGWKVRNMNECADRIQIGPFGTQLHEEDYIDNGIPLINPTHIQDGKIFSNPSFSISNEKHQQLSQYHLEVDDVILGRRGEMGRCAIVSENERGWLCGTGSLFIRPKYALLDSFYLFSFLSSQPIKKYLEKASQGVTMANLNKTIVSQIPVTLPPLNLQQEFARCVEAVEKLKASHRASLSELDALFASLQYRAFRGEL